MIETVKNSSLVLINFRGQTENNGGKLLLIEEEEWLKRENAMERFCLLKRSGGNGLTKEGHMCPQVKQIEVEVTTEGRTVP